MLSRLLTRRIVSSFILILSATTLVIAATQLVRLGPLFLGPWVRLADAVVLLVVVPVLAPSVPASLAIAIALGAAAMTRRGERQALASAGVGAWAVARSPLLLAFAGALVLAALAISWVPASFRALTGALASLAARASLGAIHPGQITALPDGTVLVADRVIRGRTGNELLLEGVLVAFEGEDGTATIVTAPRARIVHESMGRCSFELDEAVMQLQGDSPLLLEAGVMSMRLDLAAEVLARSGELPALLSASTRDLAGGSGGQEGRYHLHRRLASPVAGFVLAFASSILLLLPGLRRPSVAPAAIGALIIAFHALARVTEEAFLSDLVGAVPAAWMPCAAIATAALVTWWWVERLRRPALPAPARSTSRPRP